MRALLWIILLLLLGIVVAKQPWDMTEQPPSTQVTDQTTAPFWRIGLQDARLPPLAERVALLENQLSRLSPVMEMAPNMADWAGRLDHVTRLGKDIHRLESGSVVAKKGDAEWKLTDLFARTRQYRHPIAFAQPFSQTPRIVLGITLMDLPGEKVRFLARSEEPTPQGFTLLLETRSDARVEEVQVDWLAFGPPT